MTVTHVDGLTTPAEAALLDEVGDLRIRSGHNLTFTNLKRVRGALTIRNSSLMHFPALERVDDSIAADGFGILPVLKRIGSMGHIAGWRLPALEEIGRYKVATADKAKALLAQVAAEALVEDRLFMRDWHAPCGTMHCIAGWAIHLSGDRGKRLERQCGPYQAGAILLGAEAVLHFYDDVQQGRAWLAEQLPKAAQP